MDKDSGIVEIALGLGFTTLVVVAGLGGIGVLTGCSGTIVSPFEEQHTSSTHDFILAGSAEAIQIHYDSMLASAKQMVESPDKNFHTERRSAQEKEYTIQNETGKSFWQRVTSNAKAWAEKEGVK